MRKQALIRQLRRITEALRPFTNPYSGGQGKPADDLICATIWWSTLGTIADMMDFQEEDLSGQQLDYVRKRVTGGMGSFNDFCFDERGLGRQAKEVNAVLDQLTHELYAMLEEQ